MEIAHDNAGICTITLHRPERLNALDRDTLAGLRAAVEGSVERGDRVVILAGSDDIFSAGADLNDIQGDQQDLGYDQAVAQVRTAIIACPSPIIGAVNGRCYGAALDLVATTDLVIASADARFALPATRLGLLYDVNALMGLSRRLSPGFLARLLLTADEVSAREAATGGLVDMVTDDPRLEAERIAAMIAAAPTTAMQATVGVLRAARSGELAPGDWQDIRRTLAASPERRAAVHRVKWRLGLEHPDS